MPKLPVVSGRRVVKALSKIGYSFDHQVGSHITLRNTHGEKITVPDHDELDKGTLKAILKDIGLTVEEFIKLL